MIRGKDGKFAELSETVELRKDKAKGFEAALAIVRTDKGKSTMDEIRKVIDEMKNEEITLLKTRTDEAQASAREATLAITLGTLGALVVMTLAGFVITRNIANPLQEITATADRIASGDLSVAVTVNHRDDEVGVLARTFGRMTDSLQGMAGVATKIAGGDLRMTVTPQSARDILGNAFAQMTENLRTQTRQLVEGANVLGSAASEIVASTIQMASSASESAAAVSETTTTVEEVRQTAQVARSRKAKAVSDSAQKSRANCPGWPQAPPRRLWPAQTASVSKWRPSPPAWCETR